AENKIVKKLGLEGETELVRGYDWVMAIGKGGIKVWDLATATLCAEGRNIPNLETRGLTRVELLADRRFLVYFEFNGLGSLKSIFTYNLLTGQKKELHGEWAGYSTTAMAPDGRTVALGDSLAPQQNPWWSSFADWIGIRGDSSKGLVTLVAFPSGEAT